MMLRDVTNQSDDRRRSGGKRESTRRHQFYRVEKDDHRAGSGTSGAGRRGAAAAEGHGAGRRGAAAAEGRGVGRGAAAAEGRAASSTPARGATASCLASYAEAADAPPPPALLARPPSDDVIDAPAVLEIPGRARRPGVVGGLCAWPPPVDARRELLAASVVAAGLAARFAALRLLGERGDDVDGDAYYPPAWVQ